MQSAAAEHPLSGEEKECLAVAWGRRDGSLRALQAPILCHGVETGAFFHRVQVAVAHYQRLREQPLQLAQQRHERGFLLRRAGVGGAAVGGESALVADAHGVAIVPPAMCAGFVQRTAAVDFAVARQVEMVADVAEAAMEDVVAAALLEAQVHAPRRGRAVNDDKGDGSHRPVQDVKPNTLASAVATATMLLRIIPKTDFDFVFIRILILMVKKIIN